MTALAGRTLALVLSAILTTRRNATVIAIAPRVKMISSHRCHQRHHAHSNMRRRRAVGASGEMPVPAGNIRGQVANATPTMRSSAAARAIAPAPLFRRLRLQCLQRLQRQLHLRQRRHRVHRLHHHLRQDLKPSTLATTLLRLSALQKVASAMPARHGVIGETCSS